MALWKRLWIIPFRPSCLGKRSAQGVHKKFLAVPRRALAAASYPHSDLTLNVIPHFCARLLWPLTAPRISHARRPPGYYTSSVCSKIRAVTDGSTAPADLAEQLAAAIEACAAAVRSQDGEAAGALAEQLAAAWAVLTRADPEIAARMARYGDE
jgi:hypothetical protein